MLNIKMVMDQLKLHMKLVNNMINNKKGMTLIELLVSVVLISAIMIFMYKLISDVRTEKNEIDKITDNSIKINEIEAKLQKIILDNKLNRIVSYDSNDKKYMVFSLNARPVAYLYFLEDGTIDLKVDTTKDERLKWKLSNTVEDVCYESNESKKLINYKIFLTDNNIIEIPIYNEELTASGDKC